MRVVFFDIETTGLNPDKNAIWAVAGLQAYFDPESFRVYPVRKAVRYYHVPVERAYELHAYWKFQVEEIRGNVLYLKEISKLREGAHVNVESIKGRVRFYGRKLSHTPVTFDKDLKFWKGFLSWADMLVAHNAEFEEGFLKAYGLSFNRWFCTMRESTGLCGLVREVWDREDSLIVLPKWPKLEEACRILLGWDGGNFHNPEFDVKATAKLFPRVYEALKRQAHPWGDRGLR